MSVTNEKPESPAAAGSSMRELLVRQAALYRRLETLSDAQRPCIEGGDSQPLLRLLAERRRLTSELTGLNAELAPYRQQWEQIRSGLTPGERGEIEGLFRESGDRLRRILESDDSAARLLAMRRESAFSELHAVDAARATVDAYARTAVAGAGIMEGTEA